MSSPDRLAEELTPVKRALLEIRELRARLDLAESRGREPVAIVGAALRFPGGVHDLDALWQLLSAGRDAIVDIPSDRWDVDALFDADPDAPGRMFTRRGGFVDGVRGFDAEFFGISPREAEGMAPQQRLELETAWHAFEDAGIAPPSLRETKTGVFLGVCNNDYGRMLFAHPERIDPHFGSGNASGVVAGRVSYFLGLQGPSMAIDTACSSSLVALHLAVQSLRSGESDLAIAGGINLILSPEMNINFSKAHMMAPDGRCKTFDASADGYVRGEGCGIVVLRRLRDCSSADRVLAVVRGSAVNQDGRSGGLTAPNGPSQEAVIRAAIAAAGVEPAQVGYVEAHGTGTALGDPIEVQALAAALGAGRAASRPVAIGSIKTNLGHLEAAAGIAGVLKVALALRHREIPPHLHLRTLNPLIDWAALPVVVPTARTPWAPIDGRWIAGVSSFGFSGTNAHVVLEAAAPRDSVAPAAPHVPATPQRGTVSAERPLHVLTLSARNARALDALAAEYVEALDHTEAAADLCFTANVGRAHFAHRLSVRGDTSASLRAGLAAAVEGRVVRGVASGVAVTSPRVAFLFTGGGAQSAGMAQSLYERAPVFRASLDACAAILDPLTGRSLIEVINTPGDLDAPVNETRFGQPALVAVEIALAALWRSWGIEPVAVLGHSLGEYAAAHIAGAISMDDALRMVVERTRLVDALSGAGAMATVHADADQVAAMLAGVDGVTIAAYNSPAQVVISGTRDGVESVAAAGAAKGIRVTPLRVAYASHSAQMDPVLAPFERALDGIRFSAPHTTFISNLTGAPAGLDVIGRASYWRDHLRRPVRFAQSVEALVSLGITHFVEIGPHPVLVGMGAACAPPGTGKWLPSLRRNESDWDTILETLQELYADGASVDWAGFDAGAARRRVAAPVYPFQHRDYWAEWATGGNAQSDTRRDTDTRWRAVTGALAHDAERGPVDVDLSGYDAKWECLKRLTVAHIAATLRAAAIFATAGDRATADDVQRRLGAPERYRHLLGRWLTMLARDGQLRADGAAFVADRPVSAPDLVACWADADRLLSDNTPVLAYIRRCAERLQSVIGGTESPLETLFPGGGFELADALYRRSPTARYANDLAASAIATFMAERTAGATSTRVLEVGAGTGGTTAAVLPVFAGANVTYRFTDVTPVFLDRARESFAAYPFVEFGELDLDRELDLVSAQPGTWDLVIASNVVHATRDLRASLRRLRALVAPGGVVLLIESTAHLAWFDITTGLIEGWQHFSDDLRTDNPLLPPAVWVEALRDAGFDDVGAWPPSASPASSLGQHVIAAHVGGDGAGRRDVAVAPDSYTSAGVVCATAAAGEATAFRERFAAALAADRLDLLRDFVRERVVRVLRLDPSQLPDRNARLMDLGLDSLMAVQLRNQLGAGLGLERPLPATLIFDHPTIDAVAAALLERVAPRLPDAGAAATKTGIEPAAAAPLGREAIAAMTEAQIEALLLDRLGQP